jgi:hypothetical protein
MDYSNDQECFRPWPPVFVMYQLEMLSKLSLNEEQLRHLAATQAECMRSIMQAQADYFRSVNEMLISIKQT